MKSPIPIVAILLVLIIGGVTFLSISQSEEELNSVEDRNATIKSYQGQGSHLENVIVEILDSIEHVKSRNQSLLIVMDRVREICNFKPDASACEIYVTIGRLVVDGHIDGKDVKFIVEDADAVETLCDYYNEETDIHVYQKDDLQQQYAIVGVEKTIISSSSWDGTLPERNLLTAIDSGKITSMYRDDFFDLENNSSLKCGPQTP